MNIYSVIHSYFRRSITMDFSKRFEDCGARTDYILFLQHVGLKAYVIKDPSGRMLGVNLGLWLEHASVWANTDIQDGPRGLITSPPYWLSGFIEIVLNNFESYGLDIGSIRFLILTDEFRALYLTKAFATDVIIGELMKKFTGLQRTFDTVEDFELR